MSEHKTIPVRTALNADTFLIYLIQQVTGQASVEILAFFNDFGREVAIIGAQKRKRNSGRIRKDIRDYYPGTSIPFKLLVKGHMARTRSVKVDFIGPDGKPSWKWDHIPDEHYFASVNICFPEASASFDSGTIDTVLLEKMLLGGDDLPPFKQPDPRNPKMFKDLIAKVLNKPQTTKKRAKTESNL